MIQTYEGALTETDSILQRMKTLADQAANGTYQDDVDRDAIQLEFNQLNDELNQIADTDYNGVVVLNGGEMADGTKAVDGKFDYSKRTARELVASDINKLDYQLFDDAPAAGKKADAVWKNISNNTWDRADASKANGPDYVDVKLQYNAENKTWSAISASNGAQVGAFKVNKAAAADGLGGTKNGGFMLSDGTNEIANVVIDESKLVNGDTITLRLNNPNNATAAATNMGSEIISNTVDEKGAPTDIKKVDMNLTTIMGTAITDSKMTNDINKILDAFDGAKFEFSYQNGTAKTDGSNYKLTLNDSAKTEIAGTAMMTAGSQSLADGTKFWVDGSAGTGELKVYTVKSTGGTDAQGDLLFTIKPTADTDTNTSAGTVTWKLGIERNAYDASKTPSVEVVNSSDAAVSKANAFSQATAPLTYTDHIILQSGARTKDAVDFTFKYSTGGMGELKANMNCSARADGLNTANLSLRTAKDANYAIDRIDEAINKVSMVRATFGAVQNRLEHKIDNMNVTKENMTSAESRIRDTNMAEEMTNFTKNQILSQASQAMLAQANQLPQGVLQLLG